MTRVESHHSRPAGEPGKPVGNDEELVVVGIGASAGGLMALRTFFSLVPERTGLAYVVVVHLSPDYESHMADLLQSHTSIPVQQVTGTVHMEPDHVYIIPPNANLSAVDTHLRLSALPSRCTRSPVDHFFRTLAASRDGTAVGVILTGTGSDGALGIKAIKERNGFTVVQDPGEAEHDGMPRSAIATELVDRVLPLTEIPAAVVGFARMKPTLSIAEVRTQEQELLLHKMFGQIRAQTGRDFGRYKRSTLLRRVQRRMQVRQVEDLGAYLELLRQEREEVQALSDDFLITVTRFFRDPDVWDYLAADVVPRLFSGKGANDVVRAWSTGCATGEEAYSLAILLLEEAARHPDAPSIQIFASDLHEKSVETAREGFYPGEISADVSAERLNRFFNREEGGYRVRREVRQHVTFTAHNLLGHPPFSRLDLICCRNMMIYLESNAQRDVVQLFHHALVPGGVLLVGASETVVGSHFEIESKRHHTYSKRLLHPRESPLPSFPLTPSHGSVVGSPSSDTASPASNAALHLALVEQVAPPSMLVSSDGRVVHLSRHAGRYLAHPGGNPTVIAHQLVREELRIELQTALHLARETGAASRSRPVAVRLDGVPATVMVDVRPAPSPEQSGCVLVIFDERAEAEPPAVPDGGGGPLQERVRALEAELEDARRQTQSIVGQYESTQEEMRAANEELQSTNEELRSTLEELETSREEFQSMNEELQTLNQENRIRVEELSQLSSDLQNLLTATEIATIFLDRELRILRFTPKVGELFNVRPHDRGRPLSDLTHRLGYSDLGQDAERVLRTLTPVEQEVEDQQGRWYITRLLPYRSVSDRIEGVVITFLEITQRKRALEALRRSDERQGFLLRLGDMLRPLTDPRTIQAEAAKALGQHLAVDRALYTDVVPEGEGEYLRVEGAYCSPATALLPERLPSRRTVQDVGRTPLVVDDAESDPALTDAARAELASIGARALVRVEIEREGRALVILELHQSEPRTWTPEEIQLAEDVAERTWAALAEARAEQVMRAARDEAERANTAKSEFLSRMSHELRTPLNAILGFSQLLEADLERDADREAIEQIVLAGRHLLALIDEVLDLALIEAGGVNVAMAPVVVEQVVNDSLKLVAPLAAPRRISLSYTTEEEALVVRADAQRLRQVLINLLSNAVKYNHDGGSVEVAVAREPGGRVVIAVTDSGWGLSAAEQLKLFVPFERLKAEAYGVPGTGLGLSLSKGLVEAMGGEVSVKSAPGEGSTFSVALPAAPGATPGIRREPGTPHQAATESVARAVTYRVLYVEDNVSNLRLVERVLEKRGDIELIAAMHGGLGVDLAREYLPDLILLDMNLPDISGEEVLRRIRKTPALAGTPVVVVSADATQQKKDQLRDQGAQAYLTKPLDVWEFLGTLASYLK